MPTFCISKNLHCRIRIVPKWVPFLIFVTVIAIPNYPIEKNRNRPSNRDRNSSTNQGCKWTLRMTIPNSVNVQNSPFKTLAN